MILNNKVSQRLEIIGFKESVKKSTSRIQGSMTVSSGREVFVQFYIGYDKILPISVNGSFRDLINCAYSDSFLLVIRKGICHIPEGLSDINSFPITWMLDILATFPDGFQPFFFTFLSGIPFYDERHNVVFIAFFHEDARVFRCIVAGIQPDGQWFFRQPSKPL